MTMLEYVPMLLPLLFGGVGFLIGRAKGAPLLGSALGLCLGPVGWLTMALIPRKRARYCQLCYGTVGAGDTFCPHCHQPLPKRKHWYWWVLLVALGGILSYLSLFVAIYGYIFYLTYNNRNLELPVSQVEAGQTYTVEVNEAMTSPDLSLTLRLSPEPTSDDDYVGKANVVYHFSAGGRPITVVKPCRVTKDGVCYDRDGRWTFSLPEELVSRKVFLTKLEITLLEEAQVFHLTGVKLFIGCTL